MLILQFNLSVQGDCQSTSDLWIHNISVPHQLSFNIKSFSIYLSDIGCLIVMLICSIFTYLNYICHHLTLTES